MRGTFRPLKNSVAGVTLFAVALGGLLSVEVFHAAQAAADPGPVLQRPTGAVTADALPTVQIDGVVWAQQIVGDTVYAGGEFKNARPAGAAPGTNLTPRSNMLAYNIRTGTLITSFAPAMNAQVKALAVSPDGQRLYVGGSFTTAAGTSRERLAAFDTATGALITSFAPVVNYTMNSIAVSNTTVYVGGAFSDVGGTSRARLAAFSPVNGALLTWAPTADSAVNAVLLTPDKSRLIVAGSFGRINGSTATGLGAVDAATGALLPWAANTVVRNYGPSAAMLSLSTDGTSIFSTGYWYGGTGNFEGVVAADPNTSAVKWLADCHGDTYGATPMNGVVYAVSHWHHCSNIGGFPDTNPRRAWYRANAVTAAATGTVARNSQGGYADYYGRPAPSIVNWFPETAVGTYTGQSQAGWSTTSNSEFLLQGGEFPTVNGVAQQGLVRYAVGSLAPRKQGPRVVGWAMNPAVLALSNRSVRIKWQANWDRDDQVLAYEVTRSGTAGPIYSTTRTSQFWNRPAMSYTDDNLVAGQTYKYRISATDPDGNRVQSDYVTVTVPATVQPYAVGVLKDGASSYWRMNGTGTYADYVGSTDLTATAGVTANAAGAIKNDTDGAATFNGSTGGAATTAAVPGPNTFTAEAWFRTTSTSGGKIVGFGNASSGLSGSYDRHVYLDGTGRLNFGVNNGSTSTVRSPATYNDGQWHQVTAQLSSAGMVLYVNGLRVGANAAVTAGQAYSGFWRVGGDNLNNWPNKPSSNYLNGTIDEVALYPTALTADQVQARHAAASAGGPAPNAVPVAAFTSGCTNGACTFDSSASGDADGTIAGHSWTFGDTSTSNQASPTHRYTTSGIYPVKLVVTDDRGATATVTRSVTVTGAESNQPPEAAFTASTSGLTATFDATTSTDPDGAVSTYAWSFGDGATGTSRTATRAYAGPGTFAVTLAVTDEDGATASITKNILVAPGAVVRDAFLRTVTNWGTADQGGAWTLSGSTFSTNGSTGDIKLATPGAGAGATLASVAQRDVSVVADVKLSSIATGGGTSTTFLTRKVGASDYRMTLKQLPAGAIRLNLSRVVGGTTTSMGDVTVSGVTYAAGDSIRLRFTTIGSATTALSGKVWKVGTEEPTTAQISATDSTASLQVAGGFGIHTYLSASSTTVPVTVSLDNLLLTAS